MEISEAAHEVGPGDDWCEWWSFDFAEPDGPAGFVRLSSFPHRAVAWYWAYLLLPERGLVVVRDHELAVPRGPSLTVRGDGIWSELVCETPFEHWGIALEAFGLRVDVDAIDHDRGDRMPVGLDVEWEADTEPEVHDDEPRCSYTQRGHLRGDALVGTDRIAVEGAGRREHGWGDPPWASTGRSASAAATAEPSLAAIAVPVSASRDLVHVLGLDRGWTTVAVDR